MITRRYFCAAALGIGTAYAADALAGIDSTLLLTLWGKRGKKYYVSSVNGSDDNPGTIAEPFATINYARTFLEADKGDTLYLERGSTFREQYELVDGQFIRPYGTGAMPIISGADPLPNASFTKTGGYTNVYEISLPSIAATDNPYATITGTADVLMTWEDNVRLGGRFENNATSIAAVDATPGRQWWDAANKKLYIHTTDSSSPITNGKVYEASVRTLALHGGDGFYVEYVQAEKAYAKTQSGQQGYQLLGYKSGHYYKCKALRSWNHNAGVANDQYAAELLFENVYGEDAEIISTPATIFVAFKSGEHPSQPVVRFKNCVAKQPTKHATNQSAGFYSHFVGTGVHAIYESVNAENVYYGAMAPSDAHCSFSGSHVFKNVAYGTWDDQGLAVSNVTVSEASVVGVYTRKSGGSFTGIKVIDSNAGALSQSFTTTHETIISDSVVARSSVPTLMSGNGVYALGNSTIKPIRCNFYQCGIALSDRVQNSGGSGEINNFFANYRIYSSNPFYSPSYGTTLSGWQTASGQDAGSTTADPGYDAAFFTVTIPDVVGE